MSRIVKRVARGFAWPLNKRWPGYLKPDTLEPTPCSACDGTGWSPYVNDLQDLWYGQAPFDPAITGSTPFTENDPCVRARAQDATLRAPDYYGTGEQAIVFEARRLAAFFNDCWQHHLAECDVQALLAADQLWDFTRHFNPARGWQRVLGGRAPTAAEVNTWSVANPMGHGGSVFYTVMRARLAELGVSETCGSCAGECSFEAYPGQAAQDAAWEPTEPPAGDGWQLWETVTEGSPISPVFGTAEELATWMSDPDARGDRWMPYPTAHRFVLAGAAPFTCVLTEAGVFTGAEYVGMAEEDQ